MTEQRGGALVPIHLDNAQAEGALSGRARRLLEGNAGTVILSQGTPASEMDDQPLLVTILADNSESMQTRKDTRTGIMHNATDDDPDSSVETVRKCQNNTIDGLLRSEHPERIYLSTQVLNPLPPDYNPENVVVDPYHPLAKAVRLNRENFRTTGATPLYDRTVQVLAAALYGTQSAIDEWKDPRTATLIISDGADYPGGQYTAQDCAEIVKNLLQGPTRRHIVAAIGIDDGHTDFTATFVEMGIPRQWILTASATPEDIAEAVGRFTRAASQAASADPQQFLLLTDGGFNQMVSQ